MRRAVLSVGVGAALGVVIQLLQGRTQELLYALTVLATGVVVSHCAARAGHQARESARRAEADAALRRVATLVARTAALPELFETVSREVGLLSGAAHARVDRYETDGTVTGVGGWSRDGDARAPGNGSSIACPIMFEGSPWGVIVAWSSGGATFAADTEAQIADFSDLVAAAIVNANRRAELAAPLARALAAADETRRRLERDLHDGAQQRLVHTVAALKLARQALGDGGMQAADLLDEALEHAERAGAELRDLAHGVLPATLTRAGLRAGVETLLSRVRLPLSVDVTDERFSPALEATAYFILAEALTNTVKHAHARSATVTAFVDRGGLHLEVRDDGIGGAQVDGSSGLLGLHDRAAALGGELSVESPVGRGTVVTATLPVTGS